MAPLVGPGDGLKISQYSLDQDVKGDSPKQLADKPKKKKAKGTRTLRNRDMIRENSGDEKFDDQSS